MIAHRQDGAAVLTTLRWVRRQAEWLAPVCLHSGVFFRSRYLAFIGRTNRALANRFIRRRRSVAVEQPWNGSRLRLCRIAPRRLLSPQSSRRCLTRTSVSSRAASRS